LLETWRHAAKILVDRPQRRIPLLEGQAVRHLGESACAGEGFLFGECRTVPPAGGSGMDVKQLEQEVREGRVTAERLLQLLEAAHTRIQSLEAVVQELESKLAASGTEKLDEAYSTKAEEQRQQARGKKGRRKKKQKSRRRGRLTTAEKLALAQHREAVYPAGVEREECQFSHSRPVWRLLDGRAVLVAYDVYRGPRDEYGQIPGTLGRSEYGLEIIVAIAFLVYQVGLSFDKVCLVLNFFQDLPLRKSQVDASLRQLARHWEGEFDRLCTLLAHSAVVHADETSWSINSVWAFLSEKARVLFFGVHKDAETLKQILDVTTFAGILISDDAAVYRYFSRSQKCWAHLLRKAIRLTLLCPDNTIYRELADELLAIYRAAVRVQGDGRLSDAGRASKIGDLENRIVELCAPTWFAELPPTEGPENDYRLLCNELIRLFREGQLFTFVTAAAVETPRGDTQPVSGTNNPAEQVLRNPAQARATGRVSKTVSGARRRTVLTSVLESLRQYLPDFTLSKVVEEIQRWGVCGYSCFEELVRKLNLKCPAKSILDTLLPVPSD
jgi:hypothetical protein